MSNNSNMSVIDANDVYIYKYNQWCIFKYISALRDNKQFELTNFFNFLRIKRLETKDKTI